jgi:membrane protease YdiL (CAAX protease family)
MIKNKFLSFFNASTKEAIFSYILSILIFSIAKLSPTIRPYIILSTLIYIPILSAKIHTIDYLKYGLLNIKQNLKKTLCYLIIWIIVIFPAYFVMVFVFKFGVDFKTHLLSIKLPKDIFHHLLYNIIVVGLSEEFFYRGYLQPLVQKRFHFNIIPKIKLDSGVIIVSLMFAIGHFLTYFTIFSALTFLPSIVFGILRNQTNNILASVILHGISNSILYIIVFNIGIIL